MFISNDLVKDAVARNFEIIGEAANKLDSDFKVKNSQIDWLRIIGFRNRIVHEYFGIDYEILWTIVESNISELIEALENLKQ